MVAKTFTLTTLLAVVSALSGLEVRKIGEQLEKRQNLGLGASCTVGPDVSSLLASEPTLPAGLLPSNINSCDASALVSAEVALATDPAFTSYLSAVASWAAIHESDLLSLETSLASACTDTAALSSIIASATAGADCGATTAAGAGSSSTATGGSSPSSTGSSGTKSTSTKSGSQTAAGTSSTASGNGAASTMIGYAGAAIVGAMGVIAAL